MKETTGKKTKKLSRRARLRIRILIVIFVLLAGVIGTMLWFRYATYEFAEIVKSYERKSTDDSSYILYEDGVLEYNRDGIARLTSRGEELWNQPCQISNPIAEVCQEAAAVADRGGTSIYVFEKIGLKGEIQTTRPIEKISVSSQGIVAAILQDEDTPLVMCYDAKGNILVEQKASLKNTGYPVDVALSEDGNGLMVSYLQTDGKGISTRVCFYDFGDKDHAASDHIVAQEVYEDAISPTVAFLNQNTSLAILDSGLIFFKGLDNPKESAEISLQGEIQNVSYNKEYVAVVLNSKGKYDHELHLYKANGKLVMSTEFDGEYTNLRICGDQVVLFEETRCLIYNTAAVCKLRGTVDMGIVDIFENSGLNKYNMINAEGFHEVRLTK